MPALTQQARGTLIAAMDRIIPADDYPSALQNGVMDYYDMDYYDFWRGSRLSDVLRWGQANKDWMRSAYTRSLTLAAPIHDTPTAESRVQVDSNVRDRYGIPVARLSGGTHPETLKTAHFIQERAEEWLTERGATKVWG